jgi:hypothetical protein
LAGFGIDLKNGFAVLAQLLTVVFLFTFNRLPRPRIKKIGFSKKQLCKLEACGKI